jgi:hypothetical protein
MKILFIAGLVIVGLIYCVIIWNLGRDLKKQFLLGSELKNVKKKLLPGLVLGQSWYSLKRKSDTKIILYISICILLMACAGYFSWQDDFRIQYHLLHIVMPVVPAYLGYEGIIPIPGFSINT